MGQSPFEKRPPLSGAVTFGETQPPRNARGYDNELRLLIPGGSTMPANDTQVACLCDRLQRFAKVGGRISIQRVGQATIHLPNRR
jgi:hypothetical protein